MALGGSLSTSTVSPSPSSTTTSTSGSGVFSSSGNPTSLYLYTFVATLSLLCLIFGTLVARSIHIRRRRNAAISAAIAAGTYVPPPNGKWPDDSLAPKPTLWEVHIAAHDLENGWGGILPLAGATLVPVTPQPQAPGRSVGSSWSRVPYFGGRGRQSIGPPTAPDLLPSTTPPTIITDLEPPASSPSPPPPLPPSEPVHLAVLVSMPTRGKAEHVKGGPPVVEFGVAHVAYTSLTES